MGTASMIFAAVSLTAALAAFALSGGSAALVGGLLVVFPVAAILAIVYGSRGIHHDKKRGPAIAGLVLGIIELGIGVTIGLLSLLIVGLFA
jgi:hypothetical protein